jgi:hypothetical protein
VLGVTEIENGGIVEIVVLVEAMKLPACAVTVPVVEDLALLAAPEYVNVAVPLDPTVCEIGVLLLSVTPDGNVPLPLGPWPVTVTEPLNPLVPVMVATMLPGCVSSRFSEVEFKPSPKGATVE